MNTNTARRIGEFCFWAGYTGLVVFIIVLLPLGVVAAYSGAGLQFRETAIPTAHQYREAFFQEFIWIFLHRLWVFVVVPTLLLWHGMRTRKKYKGMNHDSSH